jgi:hypothetical protein
VGGKLEAIVFAALEFVETVYYECKIIEIWT